MTDRHLDTAAGVLRFCELRRAEMATEFLRVGRWDRRGFSFSGYVFATHEISKPPTAAVAFKDGLGAWKPGAKLEHVEPFNVELPEWMGSVLEPRDITAFWGKAIRHYVELTRAIGTLILSETWYVRSPVGITDPHAYRDTLPESLEDVDGRQESLIMMLEHQATGRRQWMSEIKREPLRLEPWTDPEWKPDSGRLVGVSEGLKEKGAR